MDALQLARSGAEAGIREIQDNLKVVTAFKSLFVAKSGDIFHWDGMDASLSADLSKTLKLSSTDLAPSYSGLFVQVHSVFERYIANFTRGCVERLSKDASKYSDLPPGFILQHNIHSGRALGHIGQGTINGASFDFSVLMSNLAVCFSDTKPPALNPKVFTVSLGNCTPERLTKLFKILGLTEPFGDELGGHPEIKNLTGYKGGARALSKQARKDLGDSIGLRNRVVHASDSAPQVNFSDVDDAANPARALVLAFDTRASTTYP